MLKMHLCYMDLLVTVLIKDFVHVLQTINHGIKIYTFVFLAVLFFMYP